MTDRDTTPATRKMSMLEEAGARYRDSRFHASRDVCSDDMACYDRRGLILQLDAEREARADAERPLRQIAVLHRISSADADFCGECGRHYPCRTAQLAALPAPAPAGPTCGHSGDGPCPVHGAFPLNLGCPQPLPAPAPAGEPEVIIFDDERRVLAVGRDEAEARAHFEIASAARDQVTDD